VLGAQIDAMVAFSVRVVVVVSAKGARVPTSRCRGGRLLAHGDE